jgi:hypothetical protein
VAPPTYPFIPKSNAYLRAGQYWGIPLADGRFACGRVMVPTTRIGARVGFVAGLMDWVSQEPPTATAIAGCGVLDQGHAHIKTILHTGSAVLGVRGLEQDGLVPEPDPDSTYGFRFMERLAARHFGVA